jgi:ankyrin repeat protein
MLVDFGAQIDVVTATNKTPLHLAAHTGKPEMVALLVKKGAAVNVRDNMLVTPLLAAATASSERVNADHMQCIGILICNGADINIPGVIGDRSFTFTQCLRNECLQGVVHQLKTLVKNRSSLKNLVSDFLLSVPDAKEDIMDMVNNYSFRKKVLRQDKAMPFLTDETRKAVQERQDLWSEFSTHFFKPTFVGHNVAVVYGQEKHFERDCLINHLHELADFLQGKNTNKGKQTALA